jgi:signal transduction histidine kinase
VTTFGCDYAIFVTAMKRQTLRLLYVTNIVMALAILGEFYYLANRPVLPFDVSPHLRLPNGRELTSIEGYRVHSLDEVEFVLNGRVAGDSLTIITARGAQERADRVWLRHMYSPESIAFRLFAALFYFAFGFLVLLKRPDETAGRVVNLAALAAAMVVLDSWAYAGPLWLAMTYRVISYLSYLLVPVFLVNFSLVFPRRLVTSSRRIMTPLFGIAIALALVLSLQFGSAMFASSPDQQLTIFRQYDKVFTIARWLFGFISFCALVALVVNYRRATEVADLKKLRWVLLGISFSALFFFFFDELPQLLGIPYHVNEYVILSGSLVAPVTFSIAIIRYHLLNIDSLINRATGYVAVGIVAFAFYVGVLLIGTTLLGEVLPAQQFVASSIAAIATAILFQPLRLRIQKFVDKTFFRVRYDFRQAQKQILDRLALSRTEEEAANILAIDLERVLQVEWANVTAGALRRSSGAAPNVDLTLDTVRGNPRLVEQGAEFREMDFEASVALAIPLKSEDNAAVGTLALGRKRSGARLTIEDVDLAISASRQAALAIERSQLQERVLEEQAEANRMKQLSEMKSAFVRSVSHDLKTPLTSIKLFVQLLGQQFGATNSEAQEYLRIIDGESDRLKMLIDNVLDHARIERGAMQYNFANADLNMCVRQAVESVQYLLKIQGFRCELDLAASALPIEADATPLHTALVNILSNAMKYSDRDKRIAVRTYHEIDVHGRPIAAVECVDHGVGIAPQDLARLFEPYFRASTAAGLQAPGTGLGLSNVKHIVEAHGGVVTLESATEIVAAGTGATPGTTVSIKLPLVS